ncbi:MAG: HD domain-containing phosphohydrolase [Longimicrobiales bacterium]
MTLTETAAQTSELLQKQGKAFILTLHAAMQNLKIYPLENATAQQSLAELQFAAVRILDRERVLHLRMSDAFLFLNDARLRTDLAGYAAFSYLTSHLARHGIGELEVGPDVTVAEWPPFLSLLLREPDASAETPYHGFHERLQQTPVQHIRVGTQQASQDDAGLDDNLAKETAKRTYAQSVNVARQVLTDVRLGKAVNVRRVKRSVQSMVDQVLNNEHLMLGMTTLRDFDDYTFTHCVNVCIFSIILGQKLGMSKLQLYELGLGALFHDIGKMRVGAELVTKPAKLTDEEFERMQQHPTEGLLSMFSIHGFGEVPWRPMLIAYEHHMKIDLSGYPRNRRPRNPTLLSRIVAIADSFEAGTAKRSYQQDPLPPEAVLQEMRDNPRRGLDPVLVKALINVTGIFPVGTVVILDTHELAVVTAANPDRKKLHQPLVKIITDPLGRHYPQPIAADLSEINPATGRAARAILKTTDPAQYGIRVGDYFA